MERGFVGLNVAVLAIGDAASVADEPPAQLIIDRLGEAGHRIVARAVLPDVLQQLRAAVLAWVADPEIDVVIATAGVKTEHAHAAIGPLVTKPLTGFTDLFRWLTYEEIGSAAMLVEAGAALCKTTCVFVLPSSIGAVRTALDKLLVPQLDYRTKPRNLVMLLPRVAHVETAEAAEKAAPWIVPKTPTAKLQTVAQRPPAEPRPAPPADAFPRKEPTNVGPPPPPPAARARGNTAQGAIAPKPPAATPVVIATPPAPVVIAGPAVPPEAVLPPDEPITLPIRPRRASSAAGSAEPVTAAPTPPPEPARRARASSAPATEPTTVPIRPVRGSTAPPAATSVVVDEALVKPIALVTAGGPARTRPRSVTDGDELEGIGSTLVIPRQRASQRGAKVALLTTTFALAAMAAVLIGVLATRDRGGAARAESARGAYVPTPAPDPAPAPAPTNTDPVEPVVEAPALAPIDPDAIEMETPTPTPARPIAANKPPPTTAIATRPPTEPKPRPAKEPPPVEKPIAEAPLNAETDGCDEVSCILDRYARPCCTKYKPVEGVAPAPAKPSSGLPAKLDRAMIQAGMSPMKPAVIQCGEQHAGKGTVSLLVQVAPSGAVTSVGVRSAPDAGLGECVAAAVRKASFDETDQGGSFGYPFVF